MDKILLIRACTMYVQYREIILSAPSGLPITFICKWGSFENSVIGVLLHDCDDVITDFCMLHRIAECETLYHFCRK